MRVMTVLGPVEPKKLGMTLPHEHILVDLRHSGYGVDSRLDDVDLAVDELRSFKEAGGGAVVDITNRHMARNVMALKKVAQETGLHVITATGYYTEPYYPQEVYELTTNKLADVLIRELTEGIDGTGIRAGIIGEIGTRRDYMRPAEERVFRAAARAHKDTGAPISTHSYLEELIFDQIEIFRDEAVDLQRVIIGHLGDYRDMDRLRTIAATGVWLQIDHIGMEDYPFQRDHSRAKVVAQLVRDGYHSQLLLSMDVCFRSRLHWYGGTGYDYLLESFVPVLKAEGVSDAELHTMTVENPQRALAFQC